MSDIDYCKSSHCSGIQGTVNELCKKMDWQVGHLVMVYDPTTYEACFCTCSCLAFGTVVQAKDGKFMSIENFKINDIILAAGVSLDWQPEKIEYSQGTSGVKTQEYAVLIRYADTHLTVKADHVFLVSGKKIKQASKLTTQDKLIAPDGNYVDIKSIHLGEYKEAFHHIATKQEKPNTNLKGHLINTNGVVSGDYAIQKYFTELSPSSFIDDPDIGSLEYIKKWGDGFFKCTGKKLFHFQ